MTEKKKLQRLSAQQVFQLNIAVQARFKEFSERKLSKIMACKELAEGLGFLVSASALDTALTATELTWLKRNRQPDVISNRDVLEALTRDHLRMCEQLGFEPSATLKRFYEERESVRRESREAQKEKQCSVGSLPF